MTTPASGQISITEIVNELDYAILPTPIEIKGDLYNTANTGGGTGLMYHNLNMDNNNTTSAKVAIYDPLNANSNMSMSNWYNYTRDIGMVMTYLITNNSSYNVNIDLVIWDQFDTPQGTIYNATVNANDNTGTQTVDTGLLTITGGGGISSGYRVAVQNVTFANPPTPGQTFSVSLSVDSASDTDGVGAGTTRTIGYSLGSYTESGPPAPPPTAYTPAKATDTSGSLIYVNKRTTISITIT